MHLHILNVLDKCSMRNPDYTRGVLDVLGYTDLSNSILTAHVDFLNAISTEAKNTVFHHKHLQIPTPDVKNALKKIADIERTLEDIKLEYRLKVLN
jgi:hypothetical protein